MSAEGLIELNARNFSDQVAQGVTLVDFWAPWCGPCRMQTPILEGLAGKLAGQAVIAKVNVDDEQDLAVQFNVSSIPTLILFKSGQIVQSLSGLQRENELLKVIQAAL